MNVGTVLIAIVSFAAALVLGILPLIWGLPLSLLPLLLGGLIVAGGFFALAMWELYLQSRAPPVIIWKEIVSIDEAGHRTYRTLTEDEVASLLAHNLLGEVEVQQ